MLASLLTFFVVGFFGLIALAIVFAILGFVFSVAIGIASLLLFKVAPILLIGWLIVKLIQRSGSQRGLSSADRRWLDG